MSFVDDTVVINARDVDVKKLLDLKMLLEAIGASREPSETLTVCAVPVMMPEFEALVSSGLGSILSSTHSSSIAKQSLLSIAPCVAVLCLLSCDQKSMLTNTLKQDKSLNSANQALRQTNTLHTAYGSEIGATTLLRRSISSVTFRNKVLPQALIVVKSSLTQGQAVTDLVYSGNASGNARFHLLFDSICSTTHSSGIAMQSLLSIARVLCLLACHQKCMLTTNILKQHKSLNSVIEHDTQVSCETPEIQSLTAVIAVKIGNDLILGSESKVSGSDEPYPDYEKIVWLSPSVALAGSGSYYLFHDQIKKLLPAHFNNLELQDLLNNMADVSIAVKDFAKLKMLPYPFELHKLSLTLVGDHGAFVNPSIYKISRTGPTSMSCEQVTYGVMSGSGAKAMKEYQAMKGNGFDHNISNNNNQDHRIAYGKQFVLDNLEYAIKKNPGTCGGKIRLAHIHTRDRGTSTMAYYTKVGGKYRFSQGFKMLSFY